MAFFKFSGRVVLAFICHQPPSHDEVKFKEDCYNCAGIDTEAE